MDPRIEEAARTVKSKRDAISDSLWQGNCMGFAGLTAEALLDAGVPESEFEIFCLYYDEPDADIDDVPSFFDDYAGFDFDHPSFFIPWMNSRSSFDVAFHVIVKVGDWVIDPLAGDTDVIYDSEKYVAYVRRENEDKADTKFELTTVSVPYAEVEDSLYID